ncbi:ROK family protein [Desulfofalx alkaliphila]|uniref:ROK family protein n=1 Tax=Desulfofalx alkaliphila TaxID=105483 RepID=UPI0004E1C3C0|nr:ROK family protein [Desulfofalx alkaliphila]
MNFDHVVGVDLGGTKILTALADMNGAVQAEVKVPSGADEGPEGVIERILGTVSAVQRQSGAYAGGLRSVSVGVPGQVDIKGGVVHFAPNLRWQNIPLKDILENKLQVPVYLENDANAAALGEHIFGAGCGARDLVYVTVGTGVGGGIILDGRIWHGVSGSAGEIGHITVMPDGPLCSCGARGCLEALASGTAIARAARESVEAGSGNNILQAAQGRIENVDARAVAKAAQGGDREAKTILAGAARALGIGISSLVAIINPQMVVLGGGVMDLKDLLWPVMKREIEERTLKASREPLKVVAAALGPRSGVVGALALGLRQF